MSINLSSKVDYVQQSQEEETHARLVVIETVHYQSHGDPQTIDARYSRKNAANRSVAATRVGKVPCHFRIPGDDVSM
jgi:hypothetical protein